MNKLLIVVLLAMNVALTGFLTYNYINVGMSEYELTRDLDSDQQRFINTFKYHEEVNVRLGTFRQKNLAGLYNDSKKTITMRADLKEETFLGVFVHEYAHFLTYKYNHKLNSLDVKKQTGVDSEEFADMLGYYLSLQLGVTPHLYYINEDDIQARVASSQKLRKDINFLIEMETGIKTPDSKED